MKEGNQWIMIARVVHYSSKCLMTVRIRRTFELRASPFELQQASYNMAPRALD